MNRLKILKITLMALLVFLPMSANAGAPGFFGLHPPTPPVLTDAVSMQLVSYYDLRNRESFVQVSNVSASAVAIHVQIFQNDLIDCPELNFYDTLTPNDTHIYNLDDLVGNALPVNIDIGDDSNGFVVITQVEASVPGSSAVEFEDASLIGNFRIVDATGYEYRTNSGGFPDFDQLEGEESRFNVRFTANFNQIGGNNQSDMVGITIFNAGPGPASVNNGGTTFETFVYNNAEFPTSCDTTTFVCGGGFFGVINGITNVAETDLLNQGINDVFPSTNGDSLICAGNQDTEGFVDFIGQDIFFGSPQEIGELFFVGYSGLNNGDGTGSLDSWVGNPVNICDFFPDGNCPLAIGGIEDIG